MEKANHSAEQRWWRRSPDALSVLQAQSGIGKLSVRMDERRRVMDGIKVTVAELSASETLLEVPVRPFQCLVSFNGNLYSAPPGLPGALMQDQRGLGANHLTSPPPQGSVLSGRFATPGNACATPAT